jgi:tRNA modification GTPase
MSNFDDTIAAIATAPGEGGVAIVRVSGPDALKIADSVFRGKAPKPSERSTHTIVHGHIVDPDGGEIDEVLLLIMRSPQSYTSEDVIEFQGHGGNIAAKRILRRVLDEGARMAEPGEFTKRAFLNGRIDLLQAEAVLDLVHAESDRAAVSAVEQLEGILSRKFNDIYDTLVNVAADLEASLDFPEEELPTSTMPNLESRLGEVNQRISNLIFTWEEGHILREGALVVISGKPNVGKSTMMNALLGRDRSIVSHVPGTTRDTIEERLVLEGIPIRLVDTAGLRETECEVEREGVRRAMDHIQKADIHLYLVDASQPIDENDRERFSKLKFEKCIIVLNKIDLGNVVRPDRFQGMTVVRTCMIKGMDVDEVRHAIALKLSSGIDMRIPPHATISERHRRLLVEAQMEIKTAIGLLNNYHEDNIVLVSNNLRNSIELIGMVTGKVYQDELLRTIFSRFCIGK